VKGGLLVENGRIADVGPRLFNDAEPTDPEVIDARGLVLTPGLIDARVFTGEPGSEHRETLETASAAAAAGGVTAMVVMPNTDPVIDEPSLVDFILRRAAATAKVRVLPCGALTRGLKGAVMTEMGLMREAGAVAFGDGDRAVANARVLRRALSYAATFDALVVGHAEDPDLTADASATEGEFATRLGLPAAPAIAEAIIVERDIRLVELTGARYHFGQISTRASLEIIAAAKARGLPVTCGVSAHHLALNELDVGQYLTFRKVRPPLRSEDDRAAMVEGVASGVIDTIVSSHEPQGADTKRQPFASAAAGSVGLETLLPAALALAHNEQAGLARVLDALTAAPARIFGLSGGTLAKGAQADLTLMDVGEPFQVDAEKLHSRARNTAFEGRKFQGRAKMTFVGGACVFDGR
jgi:dihydroorotase